MCIAHLGGAGNGAVIAYDLNTGEEKWRWTEEGPDYGSPVNMSVGGTECIVTPTEKSIVSIAVDNGRLLWSIPFPLQRMAYNAATPVVNKDLVIVSGKGRGTRALKIEKKGEGFSATELWKNNEVDVQFNTPVLSNDLIFGYSSLGQLFCLDAASGTTAWVDTVKHDRSGFAAILDAGKVIMALPSSSQLIVYKPDSKGYAELARIKVADTPVYAHPVIAGSRIYIKDQEKITLWTIK
jgi:outer membrane protein assembly factor BamB